MRRAVALATVVAIAFAAGCGRRAPAAFDAESSHAPIVVASSPDLGCVSQGGAAEEIVAIHNRSGSSVKVARWTSSCDCLSVSPQSLPIDHGGKSYVRIAVQFADQPDFVGDLRIHVEGMDETGATVAAFDVLASIVSHELLTSQIVTSQVDSEK